MAAKGLYETVKQAIQDVVAPQVQELKGEISGLRGEMRQVEKRMEEGFIAIRNEMRSEIGAVRSEIGAVRSEIGAVSSEVSSLRSEMSSMRNDLTARIDCY
jgi:prefoldin subunit 5